MHSQLDDARRPAPSGAAADVAGNSLLASLPPGVLAVLRPSVESVRVSRGRCLTTLARDVPHVYFPVSALLTIDVARVGAEPSHLRVVGSDGMAGGLSMLIGADLPGLSVSVARSGTSLRVPGAAFRQLLDDSAALRRLVRTYTVVLRGNVERWSALPGNAALGAPLLSQLNVAIARQH
jgi:hypothetical protein